MSHPLDAALHPLTLPPPRGIIPHGLADLTTLVGEVADGLTLRERSGALRLPRTPAASRHRRWLLGRLTYSCALWAAEEGVTDPVTAIRDAYDQADRTLDDLDPHADTKRLGVLVDALGRVTRALTEGSLDVTDGSVKVTEGSVKVSESPRAGALIALAMHAATWATTITTQEQP